ncbi:MAG: Photosystem I reaction center subunit II [Acaryochloridaceae cyanobacterium SU_2_1]|nr:Photosystem I reaction center subunit II [Acaryochloridaceae cyanobacterium SU_2_1]NJM94963.1 Photosystem I reaction center subunit II [Acaryochloridaceae cyanobacterium CSU_5_19]
MAETLTGKTPLFGGSTGGLLSKADTEEKYAITWTSPKQQVFEMPTGGAATMNEGANLLYLARKEQCIALGVRQLRNKKIMDYKIYRVLPDGSNTLIHPKDGAFPEKSTEGRTAVNSVSRSIGENPNPGAIKYSGKKTYD